MRMKKTNDDNLIGNTTAVECYEDDEDADNGGGGNDRRQRCDYCLLTAECNCDGNREELLVCKDCNAKGHSNVIDVDGDDQICVSYISHPSCMDYSGDLAMRSRMSPWQCIDCKTCYVCEDPGDADAMLFCDACDKGYHMECHDPKVPEKPNGKWVCRRCQEEGVSEMMLDNEVVSSHSSGSEEIDGDDERHHRMTIGSYNNGQRHHNESNTKLTVDGTPGLPTPCDSPVPDSIHSKSPYGSQFINYRNCYDDKENESQMMTIPDATDWSIDDVEKYFSNAGFPDQAKAFREQEIDGRSLLLMKRNDVLTGLSIKLGPALKIYNYVRRLQLKNVDDANNGS